MMNKNRLIIIVLILFTAAGLSAQQTYMQLFDSIIKIEDAIADGIDDSLLAELDRIREAVNNSPYPDLQTRISIIDHIIRTSIQPPDLGEELEEELEAVTSEKKIKTFNTLTIVAGSVSLAGTPENSAALSDLTLIHTGERSEPLVACRSGNIFISHTVLMSRGGFSTISAISNTRVILKNNIIIGPRGGYAVFGRRQAKLEIINNTIVVHSFGVGLMDHSYAEIRNCLVCGDAGQPFTQINSDYTISYTNISMGPDNAADSMKDPLLIADSPENNQEGLPRRSLVQNEVQRYAGNGVTFFPHHCLATQNIDEYQRHQPSFSVNAGCPGDADKNPDGSRNTLGAFGGPQGNW